MFHWKVICKWDILLPLPCFSQLPFQYSRGSGAGNEVGANLGWLDGSGGFRQLLAHQHNNPSKTMIVFFFHHPFVTWAIPSLGKCPQIWNTTPKILLSARSATSIYIWIWGVHLDFQISPGNISETNPRWYCGSQPASKQACQQASKANPIRNTHPEPTQQTLSCPANLKQTNPLNQT